MPIKKLINKVYVYLTRAMQGHITYSIAKFGKSNLVIQLCLIEIRRNATSKLETIKTHFEGQKNIKIYSFIIIIKERSSPKLYQILKIKIFV